MAIAFANLDTNANSGSATIATSASITPTANNLVLACVLGVNESGTPPDEPTGSGNSLTWVVEQTQTYTDGASFSARATLFRAMGASPSAGSPSFDFGAATAANALWIGQSPDTDTTGTNGSGALVQSEDNTGTGTAVSDTLAAFGDATNNATFACAFWGGSAANSTPEGGFTGLTEIDTLVSYGLRAQWRLGQDTSPSATLSASNDWCMISAEIKAAAGGGGRTTRNTRAFPLGMAVGMNWVHPGDCS